LRDIGSSITGEEALQDGFPRITRRNQAVRKRFGWLIFSDLSFRRERRPLYQFFTISCIFWRPALPLSLSSRPSLVARRIRPRLTAWSGARFSHQGFLHVRRTGNKPVHS